MRTKKQIELIQAKAIKEYEVVKGKLDKFMEVEKLGKLSKDYFILKGWCECLRWILEKDNGQV